jgi:hypothetical protein
MATRSAYWLKAVPGNTINTAPFLCGFSVRAASLEEDGRPQSSNASSSQRLEKLHSESKTPSMIAARIAST